MCAHVMHTSLPSTNRWHPFIWLTDESHRLRLLVPCWYRSLAQRGPTLRSLWLFSSPLKCFMLVLFSESLVMLICRGDELILPRRRIGCIGDGIDGETGHDKNQQSSVLHCNKQHKVKECEVNMYFYLIYLACLHLIVVLPSAQRYRETIPHIFFFFLFSRQNHETKMGPSYIGSKVWGKRSYQQQWGKRSYQQSLQRRVHGKGVPFVISRSKEIVGIVQNVTMSLNDKKRPHKKGRLQFVTFFHPRLDLLRGTPLSSH